ncbi:MAG: GLPGLI family protein [Bacteroidales bacterium]|jgi:GLPGLI family protein|nr:GLPGLI family protein [Bacteroidales bacterium]
MKKTFTFGLLIASYLCYSQTIDHAQLEVRYHYEMVGNRAQPERKTTDEVILLIGNRYTAYYSFMNFTTDSLQKANPNEYQSQLTGGGGATMRPGETLKEFADRSGGTLTVNQPRTRLPSNPFNTGHYFINRSSGEVTYLSDGIRSAGGNRGHYSYTEQLEKPEWTIETETAEIAGYSSQKATTRYGGRDWTVWFTPEIPVSEGPWKLRGLPGLILKAETADGEFALTATSVVRSSNRSIVKDQENVYRNISKKELYRLQKEGPQIMAGMIIEGNLPREELNLIEILD